MNDDISTSDTLVSNIPIGRQSPVDNDNNDNNNDNNNECDDDIRISATTTSSRSKWNMYKNIFLLSGMWGLGLGASFVQIPSAQNVLTTTGHDSISTVPLGLIILLSAPMAVIIPNLMTKYGEKSIFVFAALVGCIGAILQMIGLLVSPPGSTFEIVMLMIGAAVQSFTYASTNNIRFAVAYFSTKEFLSKATAFVILGGTGGAFLGPFVSNTTRTIFVDADYAGNFLQIAIMYFFYGILAMFVDFAAPPAPPPPSLNDKTENIQQVDNNEDNINKNKDNDNNNNNNNNELVSSIEEGFAGESSPPKVVLVERSIVEILRTTDLALLILCQSFSYNIMALYMSDIQLPMASFGYDATQRTTAIFAHMLGMFLPSLFSGSVITAFGTWPSTCIGFIIILIGGGLFFVNNSLLMFTIGITVVGIGWNISFVGPSAAVSKVYNGNEKEKSIVQGFNDGIMLFTIGVFQLSASSIYEATGSNWNIFNAILMGFSILAILMTFAKAVNVNKTTTSFCLESK